MHHFYFCYVRTQLIHSVNSHDYSSCSLYHALTLP